MRSLPKGGLDDVKYHLGAEGVYRTQADGEVRVAVAPNPSHLEAVDPVVEGRALERSRPIAPSRSRASITRSRCRS